MDADNSNIDSFKKYSIFSTIEDDKKESSNNSNDTLNNLSQQQILTIDDLSKQVIQKIDAQLYEKFGDKGVNVIKQREVIEHQSQEKKLLEDQLRQSLEAQELLKKQLNELQDKVSNIGELNDLSGIKTQLQNMERFQIQQRLKPIMEFMAEQGVNKQDIPTILEHIQKNYKNDFYINPDQRIVEYVLWKEKQVAMNQNNYTIPKGSYNNVYSQQSTQMQQQILQQQLINKEEEIKKRAEERRRKAQII